ncbi:unnamed protein product [Malus baccata var. baccata]
MASADVVTMILVIYLILRHSSATEVMNSDTNIPHAFFKNYTFVPSRPVPSRSVPFRPVRVPNAPESTPQSELRYDKEGGKGAQLMKLSLGTPPYEIYAEVRCCGRNKNPKCDPKKSSPYATLPCTAQECSHTNDTGYTSCSKDDQKVCNYNYTYMDDSITQGVMSKETITFGSSSGKPVSFKDVVIGCGHNNTRKTFGENEMGILGVGAGNLSIISQLAPYVGGKKFSHCLVPFDPDHPNDASIMSFGKGSEVSGEGVVSTPLITKHGKNQYFFTVEGISFVPFNSSGSVSKGNMYLDSGTQVTMLPQDFYGRLVEQVKKTMNSSLKPVELSLAQTFYQNKQHKLHCFGTFFGSYARSNFLIGFDLEKMLVSFKAADSSPNSAFAIHISYFFNQVFSFIFIVILRIN